MNNSHDNSIHVFPPDLREALDRFSKESEETLRSFLEPMEASEPPPIIYHYTNDVGLKGILETGQLWLGDIFSLNDPSELKHGFSLASDILKSKAISGPEECKAFARNFESFGKPGGGIDSGNYFMCSFSSSGNDLGQWRSYADNGRGYAIGFAAKDLEVGFVTHGSDAPNLIASAPESYSADQSEKRFLKTFPIIYNDAQLAELHRKSIEGMFDLISLPREKDLTRPTRVAYWAELATTLVVRVLLAGLHFKHPAYRNEQEYRFLEVHEKMEPWQVRLRSRPYSLIRYREFHWKRIAPETLKRIVVGPAADRQKSFQFAQDCLRMFYSSPVEVTCSGIPYRAL